MKSYSMYSFVSDLHFILKESQLCILRVIQIVGIFVVCLFCNTALYECTRIYPFFC